MKAFEVEVVQYNNEEDVLQNNFSQRSGCDKMTPCGTVQQTRTAAFRVHNYSEREYSEREDATVSALIHVGQASKELPVEKISNSSYLYEFSFRDDSVGVGIGILEVYVNHIQIPESPFRVQIIERNCEIDFPGKGKIPVSKFEDNLLAVFPYSFKLSDFYQD